MKLRDRIAGKRILICAGPGGVGKTTTAAALGILAARTGRATMVATIDPAPRLVDALALSDLGPRPTAIPAHVAAALQVDAGKLSTARIDPRHAFDTLVGECLDDQAARERILENTIYRQITTTLTGAQEYAATLALYDFARNPAHERIILDTPPTANAMEFFEAPGRIAAAIESPVIRWLLAEKKRKAGRLFSLKTLPRAGAVVLGRLARLVGSRFLDDLSVFLTDFEPVLEGFLARTREIDRMLRAPDVAVILVCAPEPPAIEEALVFAGRLNDMGLPPCAFVVNRLWPRPGLTDAAEIEEQLVHIAHGTMSSASELHEAAALLHEAARTLNVKVKSQDRQVRRLRAAHPDLPVATVPLVEAGASLTTLRETAACLGT